MFGLKTFFLPTSISFSFSHPARDNIPFKKTCEKVKERFRFSQKGCFFLRLPEKVIYPGCLLPVSVSLFTSFFYCRKQKANQRRLRAGYARRINLGRLIVAHHLHALRGTTCSMTITAEITTAAAAQPVGSGKQQVRRFAFEADGDTAEQQCFGIRSVMQQHRSYSKVHFYYSRRRN